MIARPLFRMAPLALSMRYSVRLLSNSSVFVVCRYFGPVPLPSGVSCSAPRIRPPSPTAFPVASRMGKMMRARKVS
jgi:hypothetical protein